MTGTCVTPIKITQEWVRKKNTFNPQLGFGFVFFFFPGFVNTRNDRVGRDPKYRDLTQISSCSSWLLLGYLIRESG